MTQIKWKAAFFAFLLASSLHSIYTVQAEKGVTTATHIRRHESSTTISTETVKTESKSSTTTKGVSITPPSIGILVFPDKEDEPLIGLSRPKALASYTEAKAKRDESFYRHGILAMIRDGKKWGLIGTDGTVLLPPTYKFLIPEKDGLFKAGDKKKDLRLIDKKGNPATAVKTIPSNPFSYSEKGLYGFKKPDGSVLIAPRYKAVLAGFSEGIAFVKTMQGEKIAIDENGRALFKIPYDGICPYKYGVAEYRRRVNTFSGKSFLGILAADAINPQKVEDFDNYHTAYNGIKRGYIDQEGHIVIDSRNDEVYPMTPYGTIVKKDGLTAFLSPEGRTLIPPSRYTVGSIDIEDACLVLKSGYSGKCGLFDLSDGKQVIDFRYDDITLLGFNRALGKDGSRRYLLDTSTGDVIASLPPNIGATHFNETPVTWIFRAKSYYGIIDEEGNILYEDAKDPLTGVTKFRHGFSGGQKDNKKWGILKSDGTWLVHPTYDYIKLL